MSTLRSTITQEDAGRKLKYYVRGTMGVSYGQFNSAKATGGLMVNGVSVHADYQLRLGDEVCISLPEAAPAKAVIPERLPIEIVYEDEDLCIIDKPAPLACQCTPKQPTGTLENRMAAHYGEVFRPLNRLDKGTSGLMTVARSAHACQLLQRRLHTESFVREYLAVVEGELTGSGCIDLPIAKVPGATVKRMVDYENGKPAITFYEAHYSANARTLVRLKLQTGRTHQIRVHMAALGHPICGDFLYGTEIEALPGRFALHSCHIALAQPLTGVRIECTSLLPAELRRLMET